MNTIALIEPQSQTLSTLHSMMESANELAYVLSRTTSEVLKIQTESGTDCFKNAMPGGNLPPLSEDATKSIWQVPVLYKTQGMRVLKGMIDSLSVLSTGQNEVLQWSYKSLSSSVQHASNAMCQLVGVVASRRVSAEIINFSDRRAARQWKPVLAQDSSSAHEESKGPHRPIRQTASMS